MERVHGGQGLKDYHQPKKVEGRTVMMLRGQGSGCVLLVGRVF